MSASRAWTLVMDTRLQQLGGELGEPALDMIEPRGAGRDEVQLEPRVGGQPGPDGVGLLGGVVVADQVDVEVLGDFLVQLGEEAADCTERCRRCSDPITCPVATSRAATRLVTAWRT